MKITNTPIEGVFVCEPTLHHDSRGYFYESYNQGVFEQRVPGMRFVQDNQAFSHHGVLRGMHMQTGPTPQAKLVRVLQGEVWDVVVDFRPQSPTFLQHFGIRLSDQNHLQLFVPHNFLHGYLVLSATATVAYKVDNFFSPGHEFGLRYDDPALALPWPLAPELFVVSDKDRALGHYRPA